MTTTPVPKVILPACMGAEFLNECFDADFELGVLTWRARPRHHFTDDRSWKSAAAKSGKPAGGPHKEGYMAVWIKRGGRRHGLLVHRVLWCMKTGEWPIVTIDHKDMNRVNNRWSNLREATYSDQNANRVAARNGLKGASFDKRTGRYIAQITRCGRYQFLGRFDSEIGAHNAYAEAAKRLHGDFARLA